MPGQRDYPFGGWLVQRDFGPHLTPGGEVFGQGRDTDGDRGFAALNLGGSCNVNEHFSLLFSAGRSVAGDRHTLWYFALYWTWRRALYASRTFQIARRRISPTANQGWSLTKNCW